jgi:hypothetical protein
VGHGGGRGGCERAAREHSYGHGGSGGVGVDRLVACLSRTSGWLVQMMDLRVITIGDE